MELLRYVVIFAVGLSLGWFVGFIVTKIQDYIERAYGVDDNE